MSWTYFALLGVIVAVGLAVMGSLMTASRREHRASLTPPQRAALAQTLDPADAIAGGWVDALLATDHPTGLAIMEHPMIAVASERIASMRELFGVLAAAQRESLVVVAPGFSDDVVESFAHTSAQGLRRLLLVTAEHPAAVADAVDAQVLRRIDLTSGVDPRLGTCERWVSSREHSWLNPQV